MTADRHTVNLHRRDLQSQVDYLIMQVALLTAVVNRLDGANRIAIRELPLRDSRVYDTIVSLGFTHASAVRWRNIGMRAQWYTLGVYLDQDDYTLLSCTNFGEKLLQITEAMRSYTRGTDV